MGIYWFEERVGLLDDHQRPKQQTNTHTHTPRHVTTPHHTNMPKHVTAQHHTRILRHVSTDRLTPRPRPKYKQTQVLISAAEAAEMIIRVDDIIKASASAKIGGARSFLCLWLDCWTRCLFFVV